MHAIVNVDIKLSCTNSTKWHHVYAVAAAIGAVNGCLSSIYAHLLAPLSRPHKMDWMLIKKEDQSKKKKQNETKQSNSNENTHTCAHTDTKENQH